MLHKRHNALTEIKPPLTILQGFNKPFSCCSVIKGKKHSLTSLKADIMNRKVKNMVENMQHLNHKNGEAVNSLLDRSKKLLNKVDLKNPRTQLITAGAAGLVAAAGLAYYMVRRNNHA